MESYAILPAHSKGREYPEEPSNYRSVFQRDMDRILHCGSFRKLQFKTQVFLENKGDYYRTRLTHTLEVAQIARTVSKVLGVNPTGNSTFSLVCSGKLLFVIFFKFPWKL